MVIVFGLVISLIGGTALGLSVYAYERYQERKQAETLSQIQKGS